MCRDKFEELIEAGERAYCLLRQLTITTNPELEGCTAIRKLYEAVKALSGAKLPPWPPDSTGD